MRQELDQKLFDKYPKLFRQKDLPMSQTCMCWGCEVGDGWFDILDEMCAKIQSYVDVEQEKDPDFKQVEFTQVKEKFGGLRVYMDCYYDEVDKIVGEAERKAKKTCEDCSAPGSLNRNGWITCLCDTCRTERLKKRLND